MKKTKKDFNVVSSNKENNKSEKELKNAEYLAKLDKSIAQAESGEVVKYTIEEMRNIE